MLGVRTLTFTTPGTRLIPPRARALNRVPTGETAGRRNEGPDGPLRLAVSLTRPMRADCEGIAMLCLTNRTLLALPHGLNLGTRSLAVTAGLGNVANVRHSALDHPRYKRFDAMWFGTIEATAIPIMGLPWAPVVSSSPGGPRPVVAVVPPSVEVVAELPPAGTEVIAPQPAAQPSGQPWPRPRVERQALARAAKSAAAKAGADARRRDAWSARATCSSTFPAARTATGG